MDICKIIFFVDIFHLSIPLLIIFLHLIWCCIFLHWLPWLRGNSSTWHCFVYIFLQHWKRCQFYLSNYHNLKCMCIGTIWPYELSVADVCGPVWLKAFALFYISYKILCLELIFYDVCSTLPTVNYFYSCSKIEENVNYRMTNPSNNLKY